MVVKTLLFLLLAVAAMLPGRAEEIVAAGDVTARLPAVEDGWMKATVLVFLAHDCPIANVLVPEMNRIVGKSATQSVAFYFVYAERDLADAGARVTPEAAVFSRAGAVVYRGRINDLFAAPGQKRAEPTTHDLRAALDAVLAGKAPPAATTPATGCFIPTKP